jgi:pyroglutamyl-peptidase
VRLLITGFEPFGGDTLNSSHDAVFALPDSIGDTEISKLSLPVEYDGVYPILKSKIDELLPDAVICVGQAGGRSSVTPELVAINWRGSSSPDNSGKIYEGEHIDPTGAPAYFSTLPLCAMRDAMLSAGIPSYISSSAGTYVCNTTMYHLMRIIEQSGRNIKGGFIHVPSSCAQVLNSPNRPSLPLYSITAALSAAIRAISDT